mmetsp:Transcript_278/g.794  ORF Transcript_278/g.794 Transcript_278/m.794 type:complete len:279 (+) Transcript_278:297-1133(+)
MTAEEGRLSRCEGGEPRSCSSGPWLATLQRPWLAELLKRRSEPVTKLMSDGLVRFDDRTRSCSSPSSARTLLDAAQSGADEPAADAVPMLRLLRLERLRRPGDQHGGGGRSSRQGSSAASCPKTARSSSGRTRCQLPVTSCSGPPIGSRSSRLSAASSGPTSPPGPPPPPLRGFAVAAGGASSAGPSCCSAKRARDCLSDCARSHANSSCKHAFKSSAAWQRSSAWSKLRLTCATSLSCSVNSPCKCWHSSMRLRFSRSKLWTSKKTSSKRARIGTTS